MKQKISIIAIAGFLSLIVISSAYSMGPRMGKGQMCDNPYSCFNNLTQEEQIALKAEKSKFFNETKALRTEIFNKKMALEQEFANENTNAEKVKSLRTEIFNLGKQMSEKRLAHMERINEIVPGYADCRMAPGKRHHKFKGNGGCGGFMGVSYNQ